VCPRIRSFLNFNYFRPILFNGDSFEIHSLKFSKLEAVTYFCCVQKIRKDFVSFLLHRGLIRVSPARLSWNRTIHCGGSCSIIFYYYYYYYYYEASTAVAEINHCKLQRVCNVLVPLTSACSTCQREKV
jgi:hypothetical protein